MTSTQAQRGVSMIESLVAILVLAIGVMGLAGLQTRSLVETRLTNARANALLLANDLAERMGLNRDAALTTAPYTTNASNSNWNEALPTETDCIATACSPEQLRNFDLREWRLMVGQLLPGGQARIEGPDNGQIRVTFRWRNNVGSSSDAQTAQLMNPLSVGVDGCQSTSDQRDWICHQVFIRP